MAATPKKTRANVKTSSSPSVSVAEAKAHLSSVLNGVVHKKTAVTILRRGKPIAQIIPFQQPAVSLYGSMRGTVQELGDIVGPTGVEWTVDDDHEQ